LILTNAIDQTWLKDKVVTLMAFDLKDAFNGVNKMTLDLRLKEKGIPRRQENGSKVSWTIDSQV
jgi:hypothetical protein